MSGDGQTIILYLDSYENLIDSVTYFAIDHSKDS